MKVPPHNCIAVQGVTGPRRIIQKGWGNIADELEIMLCACHRRNGKRWALSTPKGYEDLAGNWGSAMERVKRESWTTNITSDEGLA